jgi:hypothetical protein
VFVSVFQEMLGFWLWAMLLGALAVVLAFVFLVVWEKTIVSRRLVHAELLGLLGGGPTLVIMAQVSSSGFTDAGGPADWFLIVLVYGVGLVATIVLTYSGWAGCRCGAKALKRSQAAASRPL